MNNISLQARRKDAELRLRAVLRLCTYVGGYNEKAMDLDRCSGSWNTHAPVPHGNQPVYGGFDRTADRRNGTVGFRSGGHFVGTLHSEEQMSSVKRKITRIVAVVIGTFAVLNLFWFGWRQIRYSVFTDGMEQTELSTLLVPRYAAKDRDGFDYSVKWPF